MSEGEARLLLDTHALVWTAAGTIEPPAADAIVAAARAGGVLVSSVTAWELGLLARPRAGTPRLRLAPTPEAWFDTLLAQPRASRKPRRSRSPIALAASRLPGEFHQRIPPTACWSQPRGNWTYRSSPATGKSLNMARQGHVRTIAC